MAAYARATAVLAIGFALLNAVDLPAPDATKQETSQASPVTTVLDRVYRFERSRALPRSLAPLASRAVRIGASVARAGTRLPHGWRRPATVSRRLGPAGAMDGQP